MRVGERLGWDSRGGAEARVGVVVDMNFKREPERRKRGSPGMRVILHHSHVLANC